MYDKKRHNRAQLIVITAFVLSITFLLLATLLNVVIYAENQAARGLTVADQGGYETQTEINQSLTRLLEETNHIRDASYDPYEKSINHGANETGFIMQTYQTKQQNLVQTDVTNIERGTQIIQNSSRNFTTAAGVQTWIVVTNSPATRDMSQTIDKGSLYQHSNSSQYLNESLLASNPIFKTEFTDGGGTWEVYVAELSYNNTVLIRTVNPSGVIEASCYRSDADVTIDYSNQTADGTDCAALDFVDTLGTPHTIAYENGNSANGTYHLHTAREYGLVASLRFNSPTSGDSPYATPSIYSITYKHSFVSEKEDYETTTTIAPRELVN